MTEKRATAARRLSRLAILALASACGQVPPPPIGTGGGPAGGPGAGPGGGVGGFAGGIAMPVLSFSVSPRRIDLGSTACGTTSQVAESARTINVDNTGTAPFTFTADLLDGGFYLLLSSGTAAPGARATVVVLPQPVPAIFTPGLPGLPDVLRIVVADRPPIDVLITQDAAGAVVTVNPTSMSLQAAAFTASDRRTFIASGGASITAVITGDDAGVFSVSWQSAGTGYVDFAPRDRLTHTAQLEFVVPGPLCAPLPVVPLTGTGYIGEPSISPAALAFGSNEFVDCGTQAPAQVVTVTNTGNSSFNVYSNLIGASAGPWSISQSGSTALPDGGKVRITVTPPPITLPANMMATAYYQTLRITTDVFNDGMHDVPLRMRARGAIFDYPTAMVFAPTPPGATTTGPFTLTNLGNAPGTLVLPSVLQNDRFAFGTPRRITIAGGGGQASATASFTPRVGDVPNTSSTDTAIITVDDAGTALCAALPPGGAASPDVGRIMLTGQVQ